MPSLSELVPVRAPQHLLVGKENVFEVPTKAFGYASWCCVDRNGVTWVTPMVADKLVLEGWTRG